MSPDRREMFRVLHESGCFVMPNPWDLGTARVLAQIGFPAIPTAATVTTGPIAVRIDELGVGLVDGSPGQQRDAR